jgi:apolipoprotein N-acyltransferase
LYATLGVFLATFIVVLIGNSFAALAAFATRRKVSLAALASLAVKLYVIQPSFHEANPHPT